MEASAKPKILLTGATGFIGQSVMRHLSMHADLYPVVRTAGQGGSNAVVHDLNTPLSIAVLPEQIDAVIHMAQSPNYRGFPDTASEVFGINVRAMSELLDYAAKAGAEAFVHCSTGSVYEPYDGVLAESRALSPTSLNGTTKLAAEAISRTYESQFAVSRLRFFMPYGPGQYDKLLPAIIDRVANGRAVDLQGGTGPTLAPIHVEDAAAIIASAALKRWSGTYNVASPEQFTLAEIAEMIAAQMGQTLLQNATDGTPARLVPEIERLAAKCPDRKYIPFKVGLRDTIDAQIGGSDEA